MQALSDDYMPNVDPGVYDITSPPITSAGWPATTNNAFKYPGTPAPVYNGDATQTTQYNDDNCGLDGLININTSDFNVFACLPLTTADSNIGGQSSWNLSLARAIVAYRTVNGPFTSIFDLNKVSDAYSGTAGTSFQNAEYGAVANGAGTNIAYPPTIASPTTADGLLIPTDPTTPFPNATSRAGGGSG